MSDMQLEPAHSLPIGFKVREVSSLTVLRERGLPAPSLGPLAAFAGIFKGSGFNVIFRPDSTATPTHLPIPVPGTDNVLELNLTNETLSFSRMLGAVPNRGMVQGDIFLNGVSYLQTISDVTVPSQPVGIHVEPGLWLIVPPSTDPGERSTIVRMASIPHGTTVQAQGTASEITGRPAIPAVDITPFSTAPPHNKQAFSSQTATTGNTARIPQDLTPFITAGTITQEMLTDPNTLLRNHIATQTITSATIMSVSSHPAAPLFGGGTGNIAFLLGNPTATTPNAQTLKMDATFWLETVEFDIEVPVFKPGQPPLIIPANTGREGQPVPEFLVNPPIPVTSPRSITVAATQIQYSQRVFLNFNNLTWPHVSVATLVPHGPIPIPPSAWG
jgi:hypothetical protein